MSRNGAQLGADGVIRFASLSQFLQQLNEIQSTGGLDVLSGAPLPAGANLRLQLEAPTLGERLAVEAVAEAVSNETARLRLLHIEDQLMPELFFLAQQAEEALAEEQTRNLDAPTTQTVSLGVPQAPGAAVAGVPPVPHPGLVSPGRAGSTAGPQGRPGSVSQGRTGSVSQGRTGAVPSPRVPSVRGTPIADPARPRAPTRARVPTADLIPGGPTGSADVDPQRRARRPRPSAPSTGARPSPGPRSDPRRARMYEERVSVDLSLAPEAITASLPLGAEASGEIPALPMEALTPLGVPAVPPELSRAAPPPSLGSPNPGPVPGAHLAPQPAPGGPRQPRDRAPSVGAELADLPTAPIPAHNPAGFTERGLPLPRLSVSGVLRVPDISALLGLYLSQLHHGLLTVFGGPEVQLGEPVPVKLALGQVVQLACTLRAQVGEVRLLDVQDAAPVAALLKDRAQELQAALSSLGLAAAGGAPSPTQVQPPTADLAPPQEARATPQTGPISTHSPVAAPPASIAGPLVSPAAGVPTAQTPSAPTGSIYTGPLPSTPSPAPSGPTPELPRREPGRLRYASTLDLRHSVEESLVNGGLFVISEPVPMRSHESLTVEVDGREVPNLQVDVDVVYVDHGRVGYSVRNVVAVIEALRSFAGGAPVGHDPRAEQAPVELGRAQALTGDVEPTREPVTADVSVFSGQLAAPLEMRELLELPARLRHDPSELNDLPLLVLFEFIARETWRGVLTVTRPDHELKIWFHEGSVAFVDLNPFEESLALGRILVGQRRLSEHQLQGALNKSRTSGRSLGRTLVLLGYIKKSDLSAAIRTQIRTILDRAFSSGAGKYGWEPWVEPPGRADLVLVKGRGMVARHLRATFEALSGDRLDALFKHHQTRRVVHAQDWAERTTHLRLGPKELRYLEHSFQQPELIFDTLAGSGLGRLSTLRLVAASIASGVLRFTDAAREPSQSASHNSQLVSQLETELQRMQGLNHFEVLGVHWSAHYRHYQQALGKALEPFQAGSPRLLGAEPEAEALAQQLREKIQAAYQLLANADQRAHYRRQLFDATERQYSADMLVKQAEVALMRGDRVAALETLETAVELDPSDRNRGLLTTAREGRR